MPESEYLQQTSLKKIADARLLGKKIVFTNGCFDLIHAGHIKILKDAASKGDVLVVGLNSDESIMRLKGKDRPVLPLKDRTAILEELRSVDIVIPFEEDTPYNIISLVKPDVLVKGNDYKEHEIIGSDIVKLYGGTVVTVELLKGRSTSEIVKKIIES